ncbi:MAG: XdhC family protein [Pseudomonadota bacterium]
MIAAANLDPSLAETARAMEEREEAFAFATVIRTAGSTAAKPGTKAILSCEGEIISGWLGGGCTRAAVRKATLEAVADGQPKLISVAPEEELTRSGVEAGTEVEGVRYARNGCPSKGTVDIFIEPSLPAPELVIFGTSPVAHALRCLAPGFHWSVNARTPSSELGAPMRRRFVLIATQGQGDLDALIRALDAGADYVGFVGSARKFAVLSQKLIANGRSEEELTRVSAPAGVDIGAITPDEIALSIMAELTRARRRAVAQNG